jgi:WD40 repeat protein
VLYKNYPPVKLGNRNFYDDEEEGQQKKRGVGMKKEVKKEDEEKKEEDEMKEGQVALKPLFTFECDIVEGRQVSCIDINSANPDLVAVGYGEYDINCIDDTKLKQGLLCFWTLKNPNFPEKMIVHDSSITCCQFSKKSPHLIAIGDSSGNIAIYNVRGTDTKPIAESKDLDFKHTDIVWDIQWVQRENKGESLISISGDGKIIEWSLRKGLEYTELMQLKRETNPNQKDVYAGAETEKKGGGMTFINTGGLSIDFPQNNESNITYFTATEDCTVHMCSMSYSEQYLETFSGHTGPIYKVRCNPFWHKDDCPIFLTCSYDWTVRVFSTKQQTPKLTCH